MAKRNKFLVDYIDGTSLHRKSQLIYDYINILSNSSPTEHLDHFTFNTNKYSPKGRYKEVFGKVVMYAEHLAKNPSVAVCMRAYIGWKKEKNVFVFSENLSKALEETDADIGFKYLPDNFSAYIVLDGERVIDGHKVDGSLVHITNFGGIRRLYAVISGGNGDYLRYFYHELGKHDTIQEMLDSTPSYRNVDTELRENIPVGSSERVGHDEIIKTFINAIIFSSYSEDFVEISKFQSRQECTTLPYRLYGSDFKLPEREYSVDATVVSGHFRWQPYSEGRSKLKHIYIKPHIRHYKTNHGGSDE